MEFLSLKSKAFGLDFSDLSIKAANLKKRGRFFKLVSWGETLIEPGVIVEGEIKNEDKVVIGPKKWFTDDNLFNTNDLIPESWLKI